MSTPARGGPARFAFPPYTTIVLSAFDVFEETIFAPFDLDRGHGLPTAVDKVRHFQPFSKEDPPVSPASPLIPKN